jgi:hypothetical protein
MAKTKKSQRIRQGANPPKDEEARQNYLKNNLKKK